MRLSRFSSLVASLSLSSAAWTDGVSGIDFKFNDLDSFVDPTNSTLVCFTACMDAGPSCAGWVFMPAGPTCGGVNATCWLKSAMLSAVTAPCRVAGVTPNAIAPPVLTTTRVGDVVPLGWLDAELKAQAEGLTGYLALFWADISNSTFIGGKADGGLHERTPYWLNGLTPLSFLTGDAQLIAQRDSYLDYIVQHQDASGWIGPDDLPQDGNQYWGRMNIILSLQQRYEGTHSPKDIYTILRYLQEANRRLATVGLSGWASARGQDMIWGILWLIDEFDVLPAEAIPEGISQAWLVFLAATLHAQMLTNGADWRTWFDSNAFVQTPACVGDAPCGMLTHGVNIGQALKSEAVWFRFSQDDDDVASTFIRLLKLDKYHGAPYGLFMADEHLAGAIPSHGTETCAVVEAVVSLAASAAILGDASLFERAEKVAFNALPASMTKDVRTLPLSPHFAVVVCVCFVVFSDPLTHSSMPPAPLPLLRCGSVSTSKHPTSKMRHTRTLMSVRSCIGSRRIRWGVYLLSRHSSLPTQHRVH